MIVRANRIDRFYRFASTGTGTAQIDRPGVPAVHEPPKRPGQLISVSRHADRRHGSLPLVVAIVLVGAMLLAFLAIALATISMIAAVLAAGIVVWSPIAVFAGVAWLVSPLTSRVLRLFR